MSFNNIYVVYNLQKVPVIMNDEDDVDDDDDDEDFFPKFQSRLSDSMMKSFDEVRFK